MEIKWNGLHVLQRFESFDEFWKFCASERPDDAKSNSNSSHKYDPTFNGTKTYEELVELNIHGWPEGRSIVDSLSIQFANLKQTFTPMKDTMLDLEPTFEIDMGAYMQGEPEFYLTEVELDEEAPNSGGKLVHVVYNVAVSSAISLKTIEMRGATMLLLCELLELHGYRVILDIVTGQSERPSDIAGGKETNRFIDTRVRVKNAEDPFDSDRMTFMLIHPAVYRRMFFSAWEHLPNTFWRFFPVYGYPTAVVVDEGHPIIELPPVQRAWDLPNAQAWITEQLERFGITATS